MVLGLDVAVVVFLAAVFFLLFAGDVAFFSSLTHESLIGSKGILPAKLASVETTYNNPFCTLSLQLNDPSSLHVTRRISPSLKSLWSQLVVVFMVLILFFSLAFVFFPSECLAELTELAERAELAEAAAEERAAAVFCLFLVLGRGCELDLSAWRLSRRRCTCACFVFVAAAICVVVCCLAGVDDLVLDADKHDSGSD